MFFARLIKYVAFQAFLKQKQLKTKATDLQIN